MRLYLVPWLKPGVVVVMDDLNTHKLVAVRAAIEAAGTTPVYLPIYSPELNPIEPWWCDPYIREDALARSRPGLSLVIAAGTDGTATGALGSTTDEESDGHGRSRCTTPQRREPEARGGYRLKACRRGRVKLPVQRARSA